MNIKVLRKLIQVRTHVSLSLQPIIVAIKDAAQTIAANKASKYGNSLEFDMDIPLAAGCRIITPTFGTRINHLNVVYC
jgi:hypothetical protein